MQKRQRPVEVESATYRVTTGCGHLYVTVGSNGEQVIETFATLGKAGGCARSQNEALTRAVSLGLKYGVPIEEYIEEFESIRCSNLTWSNGEQILSCADAIAKVLREETKRHSKKQDTGTQCE